MASVCNSWRRTREEIPTLFGRYAELLWPTPLEVWQITDSLIGFPPQGKKQSISEL
jgi:hypothetical protein